jgi:hypothetical protein
MVVAFVFALAAALVLAFLSVIPEGSLLLGYGCPRSRF